MKLIYRFGFVLLFLAFAPGVTRAADDEQPNIVFILADDLGWGELGCYGQEKILTPNVDRLAEEGVRYTRHYCGAPVCAPSRCVLLTGQDLSHAEIRNNRDSGNGRKFPGQWPISDEVVTIAEVLKGAGYATGAFGKWGLGPNDSTGAPNSQGFDDYYGYNCQRNAHSYYPPFLDHNGEEETINENPIPGHAKKPEGEVLADDYRAENYAPDLILEQALEFIDENKGGPFFLYCPFVEPHVAMQPPQEWIDRYPEEWEEEKGIYRGGSGYLPHPRPRAGYAAMISDLDEHVGAVLAKLEEHGLADNTLVVFTSDNGTTHRGGDPKFNIGGADSDFFNSLNGLRNFKGSAYEGGIRVPCVVRWPGRIEPGTSSDFPSSFPDWFVTLSAVAGAELPADQVLDGMDLSAGFGGEALSRDRPMVWEFGGYGGQLAIIDGPWKAVRQKVNNRKAGPGAWELYNLDDDPGEENDLAAEHPERLDALAKYWEDNRTPNANFPLAAYDR